MIKFKEWWDAAKKLYEGDSCLCALRAWQKQQERIDQLEGYNLGLANESCAQQSRIAELGKELSENKDIIVAHQIADETGYIDGAGWVENWGEMEETVTDLLEAHNLEQQAKGAAEVINQVFRHPETLTGDALDWR
jgi:hypothetical protein